MRKLPFIIFLAFITVSLALLKPSPHGKDFKISCDECHSPKGWEIDKSVYSFDHNATQLPLEGQHTGVNCKICHPTLIFSEANTGCADCHTDMHNQTVGPDCARCHTAKSWIVENITDIHQRSRFPLIGPHLTADCSQCHKSESMLQFDPLGVECIDCHQEDYMSATQPNHILGGYSTNCTDCHLMNSTSWTDANFVHTFFPLTGGHDNVNCEQCHTSGDYTNISNECVSCHQDDYNSTSNPNHISIDFPLSCNDCHSTNPGWKPAQFKAHDSMFPIYSGKHNQEWDNCTDCHSNLGDYSSFSCTDCHAHNQQEMNNKHEGIGGYLFDSEFCYSCHPTGSADAGFDHNTTLFALTGAHTTTDCKSCHTNGYPGTSTVCSDCHTNNYNQTTNPNHTAAGIENSCETCHTTDPGWKPATFPVHDNYYPLTGGHATVADNCSGCHNGDYNATPNSCEECHSSNYNQTSNPNHTGIGIPVTCNDCHSTEPGWNPAAFPTHQNSYALTGAHANISDNCSACHNGNYNSTPNSCDGCHISNYNQTSNPNHISEGIAVTCNDCHTTDAGWIPASFPIHGNYYPLTGSHAAIADNCAVCHNGDYTNTGSTCEDCHISNYNQTSNPNHNSIGVSTSCADCHTPDPGWKPASFNIHNNYYALEGSHLLIAGNCAECHNGEYNNTPNTCEGCHLTDYNQTNNPQHGSAQFPTDCDACHSQNLWVPSTFNHDGQYFPIYSGMHNGQWTACSDCHTNTGNFVDINCTGCHAHNQTDMDNSHTGMNGYSYVSSLCYSCHPTGSGLAGFNHNITVFPLTGAHTTTACSSCHTNGYAGTPTVCSDCHSSNYDQTTNPNHTTTGIATTCSDCHTTNPGWTPAAFPAHGNFYALTGAHASMADNCAACHNGNYTNTANTCEACHISNYNQTSNPNHNTIGISTTCNTCHTTNPGWKPASFDIHSNYYVFEGAHLAIAGNCDACHNGDYTNTANTCEGCHSTDYNLTNNPPHASAQFPIDCELCHNQNLWVPSTFDHDGQYFPIYSGKHLGQWITCTDCHSNPGNYSVFTCINCHEHNKTDTDDHHTAVQDYAYNSISCYECHQTGISGGRMMNLRNIKLN